LKIYSECKDYTLYSGNMLEVLDTMNENSIGAIVTDPPYELGFMGKSWDSSGIAFQKETWEKCLRVLKPGGYLLAFGGSRTFHRIACAIEDAGFEIRDTIMYLYGTGFPKSMNIGLAVDKKNGVDSPIVGQREDILKKQAKDIREGHRKILDSFNAGANERNNGFVNVTADIKQAQNRYRGWGTQLKPSYEPVIVARKPCEGSCVDNVIKYGVGGINIDECRIGYESGGTAASNPLLRLKNNYRTPQTSKIENNSFDYVDERTGFSTSKNEINESGRFPSNVILSYDDETYDEVCGGFPDSDGCKPHKIYSNTEKYDGYGSITKKSGEMVGYSDSGGSASRYFYCAKASSKDRDEGLDYFEKKTSGELTERKDGSAGISAFAGSRCPKSNFHPTVKPVDLMQYLVRLVTPKGETVLDPFMGSGSTGKAVMFENRERDANYKFIGVELTEEYLPICEARIEYARDKYKYDIVEDENGNKTEMKKEELF